jgi:hypothetical protein
MIQITNINSVAHQIIPVILDSGDLVNLILDYHSTQEAWTFGIEYLAFKSYGNRLCVHPNLLRRFKNIIPFGLTVGIIDKGEPWFIDDFEKGRAGIYFLSAAEVQTIETEIFEAL